ncbi:MAG: hypothetical protein GY835_09250 [bacterium]|nr:hypothetical protein [bacterium]
MLPSNVEPEAVLDTIRRLIEDDQVATARRAVAEAARRFPEDPEIRKAKRVLNDGRSTSCAEVEPRTREEFEWLSNPPAWARGKWIGLVGRQVVVMADTMEELIAAVKARSFPQKPLLHHLES